jgi:hypothetical protein
MVQLGHEHDAHLSAGRGEADLTVESHYYRAAEYGNSDQYNEVVRADARDIYRMTGDSTHTMKPSLLRFESLELVRFSSVSLLGTRGRAVTPPERPVRGRGAGAQSSGEPGVLRVLRRPKRFEPAG